MDKGEKRHERGYLGPTRGTPQQRLPMLFNEPDNPHKLPLLVEGSRPHLMHGSLVSDLGI